MAVVTDSSAELAPDLAQRLEVSVLPLGIRLGQETYQDGPDLASATFHQRVRRSPHLPRPLPPNRSEFRRTYQRLCDEGSDIFSLHLSSKLNPAFEVAQEAAEPLLGKCGIEIFDSLTLSRSLGAMAVAAAEAARAGAGLDELVSLVRRMQPHLYLVLFANSLDYLERDGQVRGPHALLGSILDIRPLLILEEGEFVPLEKATGGAGAAERLYEFITEFAHIQTMTLLHGGDVADLHELFRRVEMTFPDTPLEVSLYGPALTGYIGTGGLGVFVYEGLA